MRGDAISVWYAAPNKPSYFQVLLHCNYSPHVLMYLSVLYTRNGDRGLVQFENWLQMVWFILIPLHLRAYWFLFVSVGMLFWQVRSEKQGCQAHASALLGPRSKKESWWRGKSGPKHGFMLQRQHCLCKISVKWMITITDGNTKNMQNHLSAQHEIKFQECHVFDTQRTSAAHTGSTSVMESKYSML